VPPREATERLAREQTVEVPPGVVPVGVEAPALGRVESVEQLAGGRLAATLDFPIEAAGRELPQLLNVLLGNASLYVGVRVESVGRTGWTRLRTAVPHFGG